MTPETMTMEEPEVKKMKADDSNGDEEMTVQFEDENGEDIKSSWEIVQSWSGQMENDVV